MKKSLFCGLLLCFTIIVNAETFEFSSMSQWEKTPRLSEKDGVFTLKNPGRFFSNEFILIDRNATYDVSVKVRRVPNTPAFIGHIGFMLYDEAKVMLPTLWYRFEYGSFSTLLEKASQGSKKIVIKRPAKFPSDYIRRNLHIVFNAAKDLSDLPNRTANKILDCEEISETELELTLAKPLSENYAAGSGVRLHSPGPEMYTLLNGKPVSEEWVELSGKIKGEAKILSNNQWRRKATFFKVLISNSPGTADRGIKMEFKDFKITVEK